MRGDRGNGPEPHEITVLAPDEQSVSPESVAEVPLTGLSFTVPGRAMLFRNTLWWGLVAEYNVGISDDSTQEGYQPVDIIKRAITKELTDDFQVFVHGFQNQSALPRLIAQTVVGTGFVWFPSDRLSVFGNWGFGTERSGPASTFQAGIANSF